MGFPRSCRITWVHGQYGGVPASSQHCPHTTRCPLPTATWANSWTSLVLPMPAGPTTVQSTAPVGRVAGSAPVRAAISLALPTKRSTLLDRLLRSDPDRRDRGR